MNAQELFFELAERANYYKLSRKNPGVPGEWIANLSPEEREVISQLTSKDVEDYCSIAWREFGGNCDGSLIKDEMLKFDKKLNL